VPILDDEQFERYLKEFCPLAPESLQIEKRPSRARRPFVVTMWGSACAASLLLAFLLWHRVSYFLPRVHGRKTVPGSRPQRCSRACPDVV